MARGFLCSEEFYYKMRLLIECNERDLLSKIPLEIMKTDPVNDIISMLKGLIETEEWKNVKRRCMK